MMRMVVRRSVLFGLGPHLGDIAPQTGLVDRKMTTVELGRRFLVLLLVGSSFGWGHWNHYNQDHQNLDLLHFVSRLLADYKMNLEGPDSYRHPGLGHHTFGMAVAVD